MKTKLHAADLLVLLLTGLPLLYLAYRYPHLPNTVPTHFSINGKADGYGEKSALWLLLAITGGAGVLVYLLIRFLPKLDPKKGVRYSGAAYNKIAVLVILLLSSVNFLIIHAAEKGSFDLGRAFPVAIGLFFAVMGNLMHNIKPNYFIGIRTPWTLESEETWRRTHQLAGKIWFAEGLVIAAVSLLLPVRITPYFLITSIFVFALIPIVYSYSFYKSLQKNINHK